jgi:type II secretory pathway predicted ATPase ExeA
MEQINLLMDHYIRLLQAEGDHYPKIVRNAYKTRDSFMGYLQRLAAAEQEVNGAVAEIRGGTPEIWQRLRAEQFQVEEMRRKEIERIYS